MSPPTGQTTPALRRVQMGLASLALIVLMGSLGFQTMGMWVS